MRRTGLGSGQQASQTDASGTTSVTCDPLGRVTTYSYDNQGDLLSTTENYVANGPINSSTNVTTSATYDALGQKLTATDAVGVVSQTTYDIRGNVMQTIANYVSGVPSDDHTNVTTKDGYDELGRPVSETNPKGIVSETVYDADGRSIKSIADYVSGGPTDSQTNVTTTTTYDAAGNATLETDAKGNTTTTTYDLDNRTTEMVQKNSAGTVLKDSQTSFDADGQTCSSTAVTGSITNPTTSYPTCPGNIADGMNNQTTNYTYDAARRKSTEADPPTNPGASDQSGQPNVTTTTYDANGNVVETKVTNAGLAAPGVVSDTTATFDNLGRMLSKTEQAGTSAAETTTYSYDAAGRQLNTTDAANRTTNSSYDALGRVVTVTHPDTTQDTTTYDADGRTLTQQNSAGTTSDAYDALGRVSGETKINGSGALLTSVSYSYDADGNKLQQTTTYGGSGASQTIAWTYDKLDRIATLSDATRSYTYDANGNVTAMSARNSSGGTVVGTTSAYDGSNRLLSQNDMTGSGGTSLHSYSYSYDQLGNRTSATADGTTTNYSYDDANQLTKTTVGSTTTTYTYDANHNRASMTTSAGTTSYTYDSSDTELTSKKDPSGTTTNYAYDLTGNLTTATYDPTGANQVTGYHYDSSNRLAEVDQPSGTKVTFGYDADGNRNSVTVTTGGSSPATATVTDVYQSGRLADQTDGSGTILATFTYDDQGVPTSVVLGTDPTNGPRYYYVYNGHGDVVALTDANGNVVASYSYDEFGNLTASSESFPNDPEGWTNPYRYDGRDGVRYDASTGLYWMSVRAYDPTLGRFLQRDPLGQVPFMWADQPYVYAGDNPLINVDPGGTRFFADSSVAIRPVHAAAPVQHRSRFYVKPVEPGGGRSGHGGGIGSSKGSSGDAVPPDALWKHSSEKYNYTIYLGKAEDDSYSHYHYNFHVRGYNSGVDRHNYHLTVPTSPWYDPLELDWTIKDVGKGGRPLGDTLEISTFAPDPVEAAWQAMYAFFGRLVDDATTNPAGRSELSSYLYPVPWELGRIQQIYDAFVDLAWRGE